MFSHYVIRKGNAPSMQCRQFEQRFHALLDERRQPQADHWLLDHAAGCPRCRELLDGQRAIEIGLSKICRPAPSRDFARRVVSVVAPPATIHRRRRPLWLAAATLAATAAAVLLVVSIV